MKWMQAVCRNFPGNLQGIIAATAVVVSFDARDAQKGRRIEAKIDAGSNADRGALDEEYRRPLRARHHAAQGGSSMRTLWWKKIY
jgi:hypothetical protein